MKIIECVPNFSEGRDKGVIESITNEITKYSDLKLLDVDMGYNTNRTVVTFAGDPNTVIDAAFDAIKRASKIINMNIHKGAHSRMGATDVCPLIPISNITMKECIKFSKVLSEKVGSELRIPVYLYEESATTKDRVNLANIRKGEYEGMESKISIKTWSPDYGPRKLVNNAGVTAIGAREFLIAYNVNLNTTNKKIATDIALDIRENGRAKRDKHGKILRNNNGEIIKIPGTLKSVKAVGWYIDEYKAAQVSINLINYNKTPLHTVFEEVRAQANKRFLRVTGSEIVGLVPKSAIIDAGRYFLKKQKASDAIPENDILNIAIKSLGLNDLKIFNPKKKIIEQTLLDNQGHLSNQTISLFTG